MVATYKDIRRLTGLSLATISKYYNGGNVLEANRELIEQAATELGFQVNHVARGLRTRRSMTVGVVLDQLRSTVNTTIVSSLEERLREAGYGTVICDSRDDEAVQADAIAFLIGRMVDAIVVLPVGDDVSLFDQAQERDVPIVALDRRIPGRDSIVIDNRSAIAAAVDLLVGAGHTEIGLLAGPDSMHTMRERREGFREAMRVRTGLLPGADLVAADRVSVEGGHAGLRRMLALSTPATAVICMSYELTLGAAMAVLELDSDVDPPALVGFDTGELARLARPRSTLIEQPVEEFAERAADLLLARLTGEGPTDPVTLTLESALIVGHESTYVRR